MEKVEAGGLMLKQNVIREEQWSGLKGFLISFWQADFVSSLTWCKESSASVVKLVNTWWGTSGSCSPKCPNWDFTPGLWVYHVFYLVHKHDFPLPGKQGLQNKEDQSMKWVELLDEKTQKSGIIHMDCSQNTVLCTVLYKKLPQLSLNLFLPGMWLYTLQGWRTFFFPYI